MTYLCIVECRKTEQVLGTKVRELDIVFASRDELARQYSGPYTILVGDRGVDIAAVTGKLGYKNRRQFVPGDEFAVVERDLVFRSQVVRAALVRGLPVFAHELGLAVDELDVVVASSRLRVALPTGIGRLVLVVPGVIDVLIVHLANVTRAHRLHVPEVGQLAFGRRVLVAERFAGFIVVT